jgi:hypothetical protein
MRTAPAPAVAAGRRTDVSSGIAISASPVSSKPITLTSAGPPTPRWASRFITPAAISSLKAITAVAPEAMTRSPARTPAEKRESSRWMSLHSTSRRVHAALNPSKRAVFESDREPARLDDPPMAEGVEMINGLVLQLLTILANILWTRLF